MASPFGFLCDDTALYGRFSDATDAEPQLKLDKVRQSQPTVLDGLIFSDMKEFDRQYQPEKKERLAPQRTKFASQPTSPSLTRRADRSLHA